MLEELMGLVEKYLAGEASLQELADWEGSHFFDIEKSSDERLKKLAGDIISGFWFVVERAMTEDELREELRGTVSRLRAEVA